MKIHVLFNGMISSGSLSGGDQLFLDIAQRLPKDIEVVVVMPEFSVKFWEPLKLDNISFRILPKNFFDGRTSPFGVFFNYLIRSFQTWSILKKEKDVRFVYSASDIILPDILPAYLLKGRDKNFYWITRVYHVILPPWKRKGNFFVNLFSLFLQRLDFILMKYRADQVAALNEALYKELLGLGFRKEQLGVLEAGVSFEEISKYKPKKIYPYDAVVLARIHPVKGIYDVVKIWKKVVEENPRYKLAWIGSGSENFVEELKKLIKENNLGDNFYLPGFIPKEDAFDMLKSAKVFLCSDYENGWGLAVCEAMSASLPVVSYDIDIFGHVYKKGFISAKLADTEGFAQNLIKVLKDEKLRKKLSDEALEQAREFDHSKVIDKFVKMVKEKAA